jgi:hypothetical protein
MATKRARLTRVATVPTPMPVRGSYTFYLDADLVERARREVGEPDVVRSIEAALAAALDYQLWVREVSAGRRDVLG